MSDSVPETEPTSRAETNGEVVVDRHAEALDRHESERGGLSSRSFVSLLVVQALTSLNDNTFRWLAVPLGKAVIGDGRALALGLACFTLPYIVLAPYAGFLSDRFSKRSVIVGCKAAEVGIMLLGLLALLTGQLWLLFFVVFLMGSQSALFSPAKYGAIPELVTPGKLSPANGLMGMVTIGCSALGVVGGALLFGFTSKSAIVATPLSDLWPVAAILLGIAGVGLCVSLLLKKLPAADPDRTPPRQPVRETARDLKALVKHKVLFRTALGIGFFWMLASLASINTDIYVTGELKLAQRYVGALSAVLVLGVAVGSVLAGWLSGGKAELGLVPIGAFGIVIATFLLYLTGQYTGAESPELGFWLTAGCLLFLGGSAGLFDIPLEAFLQERSNRQNRGTILAASNFITFSLILAISGVFEVLRTYLGLTGSQIFLIAGLATVPVFVYVVYLLPNAFIRCIVWVASKIFYRIRLRGLENVPEDGGALLVINHVSWLDGILIVLCCPRPIRMLAYADYIDKGVTKWVCERYGVIPIKADGGPRALINSLKKATAALERGELVGIFAEGTITRTGQLQRFQPGLLRVVKGTDAPIIPTYLDELWGSFFSFSGGRFFWGRPKKFPYPISITFGEPVADATSIDKVHRAVQLVGVDSMNARKHRQLNLPRLFIRQCRKSLFRFKIADSSGPQSELTGGKLLTAMYVMKSLLETHVFRAPGADRSRDVKNVGVLLPPSVGGAVVNAALGCMRKVAVNLNYTLDNETLSYCIQEAGIKTVLTSKAFLEKKPYDFDENVQVVLLEEVKAKLTGGLKARCAAKAFTLPTALQERLLGLHKIDPDDLLTIIFTSGSTGEPKGVMLSHHNVLSNIEGCDQLFHFDSGDVLVGVLPFFHAFGYTGCVWLPLALDTAAAYHFNPLDAKTVGALAERYGMTFILATPTFLRSYMRRCTPEQFAKLNLCVLGAEKMPEELYKAFTDKFGVAPTEGYGCTELSPVASFNVPDNRSGASDVHSGTKLGSVGRVMPGSAARVIDVDTGEVRKANEEGLLQITGPNVMCGYLNQEEKTKEVITDDGWYNTGDVAVIDDDGFIFITGRQSRFSKIGGEMVPHLKVEEELISIVGEPTDDDGDGRPDIRIAVTSVPCEKKGEKLIVMHRPLDKSVEEIIAELRTRDLPNLFVPGRDGFIEVDEIPILGTGKLDLRGVKELALAKTTTTIASPEGEG